MTVSAPESAEPASARPGKAGRTDYDRWHRVANRLLSETEREEQLEKERTQKALGLDGKYAASQAEAEERQKAEGLKSTKKALEGYIQRESSIMESMPGLLGPVTNEHCDSVAQESKSDSPRIVRVTRNQLDAGKRVVTISDTSGNSRRDKIVLTEDLSHLESKYQNPNVKARSFQGDAQNSVVEDTNERTVHGIIKCFLSNLHNCTVLVKCKIISGTIEVSHCSNIEISIGKDATVPTVQADLCRNITVTFDDAPSGKNIPLAGHKRIFWGEDKEDRIFHAGVTNMLVRCVRDGYCEMERMCDYIADGATEVGNATKEEYQFVTSVVDGDFLTEAVVRAGATTGENSRAMTQRELDQEKEKRERAAKVAVGMAEDMIEVLDKDGNPLAVKKDPVAEIAADNDSSADNKEAYSSMTKEQIDTIVQECETNKSRGNDAFKAGEYGQAILLYTLALDKSFELPDKDDRSVDASKQLFSRDVVLSNRAACFLKLGQHEKACEDGKKASEINPANIKAIFRHGLALHAMKQYREALPILAKALELEPNNKQIKQALQFAEVRMQQEMRKRMEG